MNQPIANQSKPKPRGFLWFFIAVVLVAGAGAGLWYFNRQVEREIAVNNIPDLSSRQLVNDNQKKNDLISQLEGFGKYGDWPIIKVTLSPNRGNPFLPK